MPASPDERTLLRTPPPSRPRPRRPAALALALRFASAARARLARGDAYALGNLLFVAGSAAYCALDLLPPVGTFLDDALLVGLAALFVVDALLYLRAWGGPLVGRGPCLGRSGDGRGSGKGAAGGTSGRGGDLVVVSSSSSVLFAPARARGSDGASGGNGDGDGDGPTHLDLSAEWVNIAASSIYLAATVVGLLTPSTDVAVPQLALIYALQGISSTLFFADALLYAASWRVGLARAERDAAGAAADGGGDAPPCMPRLRDPFALAHTLNVLPALAYAVCGLASLVLFAHEAASGRAADRYEDNRNVRGRLIAGAEPPEIELTCIAADFIYLACSLCTVAAWWQEVEAEEEGEGGEREGEGGEGGGLLAEF